MAKNEKMVSSKRESGITKVKVNMPSCIQIDLVQGNELRQYEIFSWIASLSLATAVSFWTSLASSNNNSILFSAIAFSGLALLSCGIAVYYRSKIYEKKVKKVISLDKFEDEEKQNDEN